MLPQHLALMVMVQVLWGANFAIAKFGLDSFSPIFFVALRFSLVAILLVFIVGLPRRDKLLRLLPLSVTMGVMHFTLMFLGMSRLDAATSSIAVQLQTPFAAIMAAFFFGETLGWRRIVGMITAFAGVLLIAGEPRFSDDPWPLLSVVGAAPTMAARDRTPPTKPTNLRVASLTPHNVTLAWNPSFDDSGIFSYRLWVSYGFTYNVSQTQTTFSLGLAPSNTYSFLVYAVDGSGNQSARSNTLSVTTPADTTAPTAPMVSLDGVGDVHDRVRGARESGDRGAHGCVARRTRARG